MSYLQPYERLLEAGAPISHLGKTQMVFYADRSKSSLHGDPTCVLGATNETMAKTVDQLCAQPRLLCLRCGPAVTVRALEALAPLGLRHTQLTNAIHLTSSVQAQTATWRSGSVAAVQLLEDSRRLRELTGLIGSFLPELNPELVGHGLLDWIGALLDDAVRVLAQVADELRSDLTETSRLTGVPLGGPHRWVLLQRVTYLLQASEIPLRHEMALIAFWPHVGTVPDRVDHLHRLLVSVPEQLAEQLLLEDPDAAKVYRRNPPPVGIDAGPTTTGDSDGLPGLALRLLADALPDHPLWDPAAAVIAARGVLAA